MPVDLLTAILIILGATIVGSLPVLFVLWWGGHVNHREEESHETYQKPV